MRDHLTRGGLSRRSLIKGATALGVTVSAASTLAGRAEAATPKKGGVMRFGVGHGSTTDTLDPATYENGFMTQTGFVIANNLTEVAPDGQIRPVITRKQIFVRDHADDMRSRRIQLMFKLDGHFATGRDAGRGARGRQ